MHQRVRNSASTLLALAGVLLLAACASSPPVPVVDFKENYNFDAVDKVAFFHESGQVSGDNPLRLSDMQVDRIDEALATAMRAKGLEFVSNAADADLLLSWHLVTQEKTDVHTYETPAMGGGYGYGGYGYNRYSMYNCWSCTNTEVRVDNYTQGTLIIDLIDPKLNKSVWRSTTQSKLKGKHEEDQGKYNTAAVRLMAGYPPMPAPAEGE